MSQWPSPPPEAQAHSDALVSRIRAAITEADGRIPFDRYMEQVLYEPGLGYYAAGNYKFGPEGDFTTAPEISPLFSRCVARQCSEVLDELDSTCLLEVGAGSGRMAADMLRELAALDCLPETYFILELSGELRERQRQTLAREFPAGAERVVWLDRLPERFSGVVVANELLDAMPVQRFRIEQDGMREEWVTWSPDGFKAVFAESEDARFRQRVGRLQRQYGLADGYESEVNLRAEDWLRSVGSILERGVVLIFDYGFPAEEYYHPQRHMGTLMCHYRHRAHDDPFRFPGLQDITAHVDFTAIAEAALETGLTVTGFTNQAGFLMGSGLMELAAQAGDDDAAGQYELAQQIKRLILPGEMGELFKALALAKGVEGPLRGFLLRDQRARL